MKVIDEYYYANYSFLKKNNDKSYALFGAPLFIFIEIFFLYLPWNIICFGYIDDFIFDINEQMELLYFLIPTILWFFYCWYYFAFKKNAQRIIYQYSTIDETSKKKLRRKHLKITFLIYFIALIQLFTVLPYYVNWSFEKRGIKKKNKNIPIGHKLQPESVYYQSLFPR